MYKVKMTPAEKVHHVEMYKRGEGNSIALAKAAGVNPASFQQWVRNYEVYGAEAFTKGYHHYSRDLKESAVRDYLAEEGAPSRLKAEKLHSKNE